MLAPAYTNRDGAHGPIGWLPHAQIRARDTKTHLLKWSHHLHAVSYIEGHRNSAASPACRCDCKCKNPWSCRTVRQTKHMDIAQFLHSICNMKSNWVYLPIKKICDIEVKEKRTTKSISQWLCIDRTRGEVNTSFVFVCISRWGDEPYLDKMIYYIFLWHVLSWALCDCGQFNVQW